MSIYMMNAVHLPGRLGSRFTPPRLLPRARSAYRSLDSILSQIDDPQAEAKAIALIKSSREASTSNNGAFKAFGVFSDRPAVPKRLWSIEELKLNGIRAELLLSPRDHSLSLVRNVTQVGRWRIHATMHACF